VLELPQINLARLIIAGPSIFVKVLKILQNILYEEVPDDIHNAVITKRKGS